MVVVVSVSLCSTLRLLDGIAKNLKKKNILLAYGGIQEYIYSILDRDGPPQIEYVLYRIEKCVIISHGFGYTKRAYG